VRRLIERLKGVQERGQALVLFAGGLAVFLALVGMSIDVGQVVHARTDLQKMADAAAFAGAQELPVPGAANSEALKYVAANGSSSCSSDCVVITTMKEANDTITVTTKRRVNYSFLRVLGLSGYDVKARAKVTSRWATGYEIDDQDVFPYGVWGDRSAGPQGNCPYGLCAGEEVIYRSNGYQNDNIPDACKPTNPNPDYTVCSNKFKGYFHAGTDIVQMNPDEWQTFSYGGNAQGEDGGDERKQALHEHYISGKPVILPVIGAARDCGGNGEEACVMPVTGQNVEGIQFKIIAWVALELTNDPLVTDPAYPWTGTVVAHYASPKGESGGGQVPPAIAPRVIRLIE
jgi:hypothetical protein